MKQLIVGSLFLCLFVTAAPFIVENGAARAEIIISEQSPRMTIIAAQELQLHIEQITGARLPILTAPSSQELVRLYVGESPGTTAHGVTAEGLDHGAYRLVSGDNWLAFVGNDANFEPPEPWGRSHSQWGRELEAKWDALTGHKWLNHLAHTMYKNYSGRSFAYDPEIQPSADETIQFWRFDKRGSPNAVYAWLRSLGVRWYMPGELGTILPQIDSLPLPQIDQTVYPEITSRSMSFDRYHATSREQLMWSLRLGLNHIPSLMHHGIANLTRPEEQRRLHPEYYPLRDGVRQTDAQRPKACLSSPGLLAENVSFARVILDHFNTDIVSVMPEDGFTRLCECADCAPQATPERGSSGRFSDYVWRYVDKVAAEVAKTHPHARIICGAYSTYQLPPASIDKLHPNVWVQITNGRPRTSLAPARRQQLNQMRAEWATKTDNPIAHSINYHFGYVPWYFPTLIAQGLNDCHGMLWREDLWIAPFSKTGLHSYGVNHLNVYLMSRLWWDLSQDAAPILDEYYRLFYGPAAESMAAFVSYIETNYAALTREPDKVREALALFEETKAAVPPDSLYAQRLALVDDFLEELRKRLGQLTRQRGDVPTFGRVIDMHNDKWHKVEDSFVLDGKIDEPFWTSYMHGGSLLEATTGRRPGHGTSFVARWYRGELYLGITCQDQPGDPVRVAGTAHDDSAILDRDHLQLLLETDEHIYYQLAVNPDGFLYDHDRGREEIGLKWVSQAEVATHIGEDYWSVEMRIPITTSTDDPLHQVIGERPSPSMPWFFNLCRQRVRGEYVELSAFSPTGVPTFLRPDKFARLILR